MNLYPNWFLLFLVILFFGIDLSAQAPFKTHLNLDTRLEPSLTCSTTGFYDANTAVTFLGDSRADLVDNPFYGASSLDTYFGTGGAWNVQNFGVASMDSKGFYDQIQTCFTRDSNPAKPLYPNFKIAYNVAFEIGGNDFVNYFPLLILNPTLYITRVAGARDNIISVIYTLQSRERNVLLVGNYPAISWSIRLGDPKTYAGYSNGFNPTVLNAYSNINKDAPISDRDLKFLTEVLKKEMVGGFFLPFTLALIGAIVSSLPEYESSDLNSAYQDVLHAASQDDNGQEDKDIARMAIGSYDWWKTISLKAIGTIPSVGVVLLENEFRSIVANPNAYGLKPFEYVSTGEAFLYAPARFEPWVVNPNLMTDPIHANHLGFTVWGKLIGDKIKQLGWQNNKAVDDSIASNKIMVQLVKALRALQARYEARLTAINSDLQYSLESLQKNKLERVAVATKNIAILADQVSEIERIEKEAEQERLRLLDEAERLRQEALALYNQQQELLRQQAINDKAIWDAQQVENDKQEKKRLAAEEVERQARAQQELLLNIIACFMFGFCHR